MSAGRRTKPSAKQIMLAAKIIDEVLPHLHSLRWVAGAASNPAELDCLQTLLLADLPTIVKRLGDAGCALGNFRHGCAD